MLDASSDPLARAAARLRELAVRPAAASTSHPAMAPQVVAPAPAAGWNCDHRRLYARLMRLTDPIFEEILLLSPIARAHIAPAVAPLATRILHVAQLAAVDPALCNSLAGLLDERAPWTRDGTT